jgi:hypothetical protein
VARKGYFKSLRGVNEFFEKSAGPLGVLQGLVAKND